MSAERQREIVLREAGTDDVETVREMFLEYAATLDFDLCFQGFEAELAGLPGDYARPGGILILATVDGAPAGCAALRPLRDDEGEIKRLYVRPGYRGLGLGRRLAREIVDFGRAAGYRTLRLDTVPRIMEAADALYRDLGFVATPPYYPSPIPGAVYYALEFDEWPPQEAGGADGSVGLACGYDNT